MEAIKKNLALARKAISANNFREAKMHYEAVYKDMPENLEADWFYHFGLVAEAVNTETANNYARLAESFYPTLKYMATLEEGEDKQNLVLAMVTVFPPLHNIVHDAMINLMAQNRSAIPMDDVAKVDMAKRVDPEKLADEIISLFGDGKPYCFIAADIWKEMIAKRFKWSEYRNFQDRGKELWFDELAKKIQKYDPSYEMPQFKQAGCITSGDAAKVKPGE